ncbi:unnamed protein product, partial [Symbiodinium sp. KB8]
GSTLGSEVTSGSQREGHVTSRATRIMPGPGEPPEQELLSQSGQEHSDADMQHVDILEQARREVRNARRIAVASLLLAGAACAACAAVALPLLSTRGWPAEVQRNEETVLDETVYPLFPGMPTLEVGWAKCITNAVVREAHSPESKKVAVVREDTRIYVAEVRGRRVRITQPLHGWLSTMSNDGIEIVRSTKTDELREEFRHQKADPLPENATVQEGVDRLEKELLKLRGKEGKLLEALEMASRKVADKAKVHELADTASDSATKVIGRVEQALTKLDLGRVDVQKITNDILNGKVDLSGFAKDLNLGTAPPTEAPKIDIVE